MHPLQVLARLKASAPDAVVSEGADDEFLDQMYIRTELDDWLLETISSALTNPDERPYDLIILAGNAGDGKSALIRKIYRSLRHEFPDLEEHLKANWDATHSDSPNESQMDILGRFFEPFHDRQERSPDRLHLIAMNTGMINSFFNAYQEQHEIHPDRPSLKGLATIIFKELEIPWDYEAKEIAGPARKTLVIDLDKRNLLDFSQTKSSLFQKMLKLISPKEPGSLTFQAVQQACESCPVRSSCFLYFNLWNVTREPIAQRLETLLKQVYLAGDVHLSPRNLWDLLYHLTAGGAETLINPDRLPDGDCPLKDVVSERFVHRDLTPTDVSRLFFMYPYDRQETPVLGALAEQDPAAYTNSALDVSILRASLNPEGHPIGLSDPIIKDSLVSIVDKKPEIASAFVKRWTYFFANEPELRSAFSENWLEPAEDFVSAAREYFRHFILGRRDNPPSKLLDLNRMVETAVGKSFGSHGEEGRYFSVNFLRQGRFIPFVPFTNLDIIPVDKSTYLSQSTKDALSFMGWLPREIVFRVASINGDQNVAFFLDLGLYHLLLKIKHGYNPTSFDLARFFHFRTFGERIGAYALERDVYEIFFSDGSTKLRVQEDRGYGNFRLQVVSPHV